jgi:hypothetical protein
MENSGGPRVQNADQLLDLRARQSKQLQPGTFGYPKVLMREMRTTTHLGVGFIEMLQIAFIVLKICGVIHWSWLVVLLPTIISLAIGLIIIVIFWIFILRRRV